MVLPDFTTQTATQYKTNIDEEMAANKTAAATNKTKLDGIENNATADQTNGEIKTAYEANPDTNVFTDVEKNKLSSTSVFTSGEKNNLGTTAIAVNTNSIAKRDSSGDLHARLFRSEYDSTNASIGYIMTQVDTVNDNYMRPSTVAQVKSSLGVGLNSVKWNGASKTASTGAPSGGANGDIHFQYV